MSQEIIEKVAPGIQPVCAVPHRWVGESKESVNKQDLETLLFGQLCCIIFRNRRYPITLQFTLRNQPLIGMRHLAYMLLLLALPFTGCNPATDGEEAQAEDSVQVDSRHSDLLGVGAATPDDAEVLFDGSEEMLHEKWRYWEEGPRFAAEMPIKWRILEDPVDEGTVVSSLDPSAEGGLYGSADIVTKKEFRDFRLHIEFLIEGEGGNSGVYLQNRYEIQVVEGQDGTHGLAAVINEAEAPYELFNGVGAWNAYDIVFRAARFEDTLRVEKALVSIYFNGTKVHDNQEITRVWGGPNSGINGDNDDDGNGITDTPGGLKLQAEGHSILYRNIWIKELDIVAPDTDF